MAWPVRYSSAGGGRLRRNPLRIRQGRRPSMGSARQPRRLATVPARERPGGIPVTNDLPDVRERDGGPRPAPPAGGPRLSDVWVYNGRAYDLSEWISSIPAAPSSLGGPRTATSPQSSSPTIVIRRLSSESCSGGTRWAATQPLGTSTPSTMHRHFCSKTTSTAGGTPRSIDSTTPTICCTGSKRG